MPFKNNTTLQINFVFPCLFHFSLSDLFCEGKRVKISSGETKLPAKDTNLGNNN